jgi:hypothetical protein
MLGQYEQRKERAERFRVFCKPEKRKSPVAAIAAIRARAHARGGVVMTGSYAEAAAARGNARFAGPTVGLAKEVHCDDEAAGCAAGVGF